MSLEQLKSQIANEFGTPAVVIDLDRVERNIGRVQKLCDAGGRGQPPAHQDAQEPGARPRCRSRPAPRASPARSWARPR